MPNNPEGGEADFNGELPIWFCPYITTNKNVTVRILVGGWFTE